MDFCDIATDSAESHIPMERILKRISLFLLVFSGTLAGAQNTISVDVDFYTRGELRRGGLPNTEEEGGSGNDHANFVSERTRMGFVYNGQGLAAKLTAQHSGIWGSKEGGSFNVFEAWVRLSSKAGFFAQVGRQNISYDDQRIFGSDNWSMTGISHDALRVGFEGKGHKLHLIGAYNQNAENTNGGTFYTGGLQPYKAMETLWYHYDIPKTNLGISLLLTDIGMQGGEKGKTEKIYREILYGAYLNYTPEHWTAEAAYYRQTGKNEYAIPVDAWMASAKLTFSPQTTFTGYAGYDYLSGDDQFATPPFGAVGMAQHTKIKGFSSLYGSHHKFYGAMDFFYVTTYRGGFSPGLQNAFAGFTWRPHEKFTADFAYHFLATATHLENAEKPLGHEVELSASYDLRKDTKLSIGYTFMKGTETMVVLKRTDENRRLHWAWITLWVTPKLLNASLK